MIMKRTISYIIKLNRNQYGYNKKGLYSIINERYIADIDDEDSSSMTADNSAFLGGDDTQRTRHTVTVICVTDKNVI